ncbi:MAG: hypothetical protein R3D66_02535 [Alphaproteobacteria bacterium]
MSIADTTQARQGKSFDPYRDAEGALEALMRAYKNTLYLDTPHTVRKDPEALLDFQKTRRTHLWQTAKSLFQHIEAFPPDGQAVLLKHAHQSAPVGDERLQRHLLQKLHKVLTQVQDQTLEKQIGEWLDLQENPETHKSKAPKTLRANRKPALPENFTAACAQVRTAPPEKKAEAAASRQNNLLLTAQADIASLLADYKIHYQTGQSTDEIVADIEDYVRAMPVDEQPVLIATAYRDAYAHSALEERSVTMMLEVLPTLSDQAKQSASHWLKTRVRPYEDLTERYNALSTAAPSSAATQKTGSHTRINRGNTPALIFGGP